ncbi:TetR/AcrR family transcriptional regulator [Nonomuraea sp. NPDC049709]|uniref:TetR/AcrR family transcriptional regulator n=1 Tax=Nonomuraea sp. NPDC049709 TaxID=3154736 RepID=UPI0034311278
MESPEDGREPIVRAATRLFAALGYDGTSIAQIAESVGREPADVHVHFATKREIYLEVMEQARSLLGCVVEERAGELLNAPPERRPEALHRFIDEYLDMCVAHPEAPALWMHRWLSDASDIAEVEAKSTQPLIQFAADSIATVARPAGGDPLHTTYTLIWCIHGFALGGVLNGTGHRRGVEDLRQLGRFRAHMHLMLGRALGLPEPEPEEPATAP